MIKRLGLVLMLISSVMISAKDCKYEHITHNSDNHDWSIPKDCTSLNLFESYIDDREARKLAAALNKNETLTWLNLRSNEIGYLGAKELAAALNKNNILTIYVDD